jgi:hypothetical protein
VKEKPSGSQIDVISQKTSRFVLISCLVEDLKMNLSFWQSYSIPNQECARLEASQHPNPMNGRARLALEILKLDGMRKALSHVEISQLK